MVKGERIAVAQKNNRAQSAVEMRIVHGDIKPSNISHQRERASLGDALEKGEELILPLKREPEREKLFDLWSRLDAVRDGGIQPYLA